MSIYKFFKYTNYEVEYSFYLGEYILLETSA